MSEYRMLYDPYNRRFVLSFSYLSPLGTELTLVDENGEPVVDYIEAPSEYGVYAARAFMQAEATVSTLRAMDDFS